MNESAEVTRANGFARSPAFSAITVAIASDTLPDLLHSSTTRIAAASRAWASIASTGSGAIQRRSITFTCTPLSASFFDARSDIGTPFPYVKTTRSRASFS